MTLNKKRKMNPSDLDLPSRPLPRYSSLEEFVLLGQIGRGGFATVFEALDPRRMRVALKVIQLSTLDSSNRLNLENEIRFQREFEHPNIVRLYDYFFEDQSLVLVLELCTQGNLFRFINGSVRLPRDKVKQIFFQVCLGLREIHSRGIVLRDIKPENVLIDSNDRVKLCDFGWACSIDEDPYNRARAGTLAYMAPETLQALPQKTPSDVWALGIFLYEIHFNIEPFIGEDVEGMIQAIQTQPLTFDASICEEAKKIILQCLSPIPETRPTVDDLLSSAYLYELTQSRRSQTKKVEELINSSHPCLDQSSIALNFNEKENRLPPPRTSRAGEKRSVTKTSPVRAISDTRRAAGSSRGGTARRCTEAADKSASGLHDSLSDPGDKPPRALAEIVGIGSKIYLSSERLPEWPHRGAKTVKHTQHPSGPDATGGFWVASPSAAFSSSPACKKKAGTLLDELGASRRKGQVGTPKSPVTLKFSGSPSQRSLAIRIPAKLEEVAPVRLYRAFRDNLTSPAANKPRLGARGSTKSPSPEKGTFELKENLRRRLQTLDFETVNSPSKGVNRYKFYFSPKFPQAEPRDKLNLRPRLTTQASKRSIMVKPFVLEEQAKSPSVKQCLNRKLREGLIAPTRDRRKELSDKIFLSNTLYRTHQCMQNLDNRLPKPNNLSKAHNPVVTPVIRPQLNKWHGSTEGLLTSLPPQKAYTPSIELIKSNLRRNKALEGRQLTGTRLWI